MVGDRSPIGYAAAIAPVAPRCRLQEPRGAVADVRLAFYVDHGEVRSRAGVLRGEIVACELSIARSAASGPCQNHASAEAIAAGEMLGRSGEPAGETTAGRFAVTARAVVPSVDSHESGQMAQIVRRKLVTGYVGAAVVAVDSDAGRARENSHETRFPAG